MLVAAWEAPFHISGNYARTMAIPVAFAASMGWLTNINPTGRSYARTWHLTQEGALALREREALTPRDPDP